MPCFILVTQEQEIETYMTKSMLTIEEINDYMVFDGVPANSQIVEELSFSDPSIVMLCDADAGFKELEANCLTKTGEVICGEVLILTNSKSDESDADNMGMLTLRQAQIVKEELRFYQDASL